MEELREEVNTFLETSEDDIISQQLCRVPQRQPWDKVVVKSAQIKKKSEFSKKQPNEEPLSSRKPRSQPWTSRWQEIINLVINELLVRGAQKTPKIL